MSQTPQRTTTQQQAGSSSEFPTQERTSSGAPGSGQGTMIGGQESAAKSTLRQRRARMSPESIKVIICGWPDQAARAVASACKKRGYSVAEFGLCQDSCNENQMDVSDAAAGKIECVKFSNPNVKERLRQYQQQCQQEQKAIVLVDTSRDASEHAKLYNEVKIPFILQSKGGETHNQVVRDTELARTPALISETMNRQLSALDSMWNDMARRYPGLFDDFDLTFRSSRPQETPRTLLNSMSDIMNRDFSANDIEQFPEGDAKNFTEGNVTREYTFRNGSGKSSYSFRQSINSDEEYADSVADSVGFLAQKTQELSQPQVFSILDVAQQSRLTE